MVKSHRPCLFAALAIVACAVLGSTAFGQSEESSQQAKNSLRDGKSALLFDIEYEDLRWFEGATLSFKHHYADNRAYRIAITVDAEYQDSEDDVSLNAETEQTGLLIALALTRIHNRVTLARTSFHFGYGPSFQYQYDKLTQYTSVGNQSSTRRDELWGVGLEGLFGAEWFAGREISLFAEYASAVEFTRMNSRSWNIGYTERKRHNDSIHLVPRQVRFGLAVYW